MKPHHVTSADGTPISYYSIGSGPGLVVVHGSMQSATSQRELADLLSSGRTVHLLDRRGRGLSGGDPATSTAVEVADVRAVLAATGSHDLLGISTGAIIAARTALVDDTVRRLALFEPPLPVGDSVRLELMPGFLASLDEGDLPRAMAMSMKLAEMGPPWMFGLPTGVLEAVSRRMLAADDAKEPSPGAVHVRELVLALRADFAVVTENANTASSYAALDTPTLLLNGRKTRPYFRTAVAALEAALPHSRRVELTGLSHGATQDRAQWGRPDLVAPALLEFFAEGSSPLAG